MGVYQIEDMEPLLKEDGEIQIIIPKKESQRV